MDQKKFEKLLNDAVENAIVDRELAEEAFSQLKDIFNVKTDDPSSMQGIMFAGGQAVKLLESMSRSNEQILKAATLMQKEEAPIKNKKNEDDDKPIDIEKLRSEAH